MSTSFRPYYPDEPFLLPPDPREWLAEDHLAYFVSDTVNALDLRAFYTPYEGDGRRKQPYEPAMMLKILIYGYATGEFSSRRLARKLHEDVAFRVLCAENFPAHRTISEFRKRHLDDFESVFVQLVQIAREVGLVKLGTVAIDGSKVKANASKHKAMSYDRMQAQEKRLLKEIRGLTRRARKLDEQEDRKFGRERTGDELPEEIARRRDRLATIQAAKARLEGRQREADRARGRSEDDDETPGQGRGRPFKRSFGEPDAKAQDNFTDPDSRIMKSSSGFEQCFNAQIAVDGASLMIVANGVTQSAADTRQLKPLLDNVRRNTKQTPVKVLADAGYASEENLRSLQRRGIDGYVAQGRGEKTIEQVPSSPQRKKMYKKMNTKRGQKEYRRRKHIAEPPFGWIKSVLGFRSFSVRGYANVTAEWNLVCLALNLKRMNSQMTWVG
jgi:transposase